MCGKTSGRLLLRAATYFLLFSTMVGCAAKPQSLNASCASRVASTYVSNLERSYCTTVSTPMNAVTITGKATFDARVLGDTGNGGLTGTALGNPIRYAEIEVLDADGHRVQCGETAADGTFSLSVPQGDSPLTIRVNSRSAKLDTFSPANVNPNINASVLNCPEEDGVYFVSATVTPSTNVSNVEINAPFTGDVLAGAFNIYDQFVAANIFLRSKVGTGNCGITGCEEFTAAPKVKAYWYKGFNPNSYFGAPDEGLSFYIPALDRMFIMGGIDGDVDSSDTDHFDNAVILHEYGHFLEDHYAISDSPGGPHGGGQVDPRLAWSEGWGNFIQGAIRGVGCYTDTEGNITSPNADYGMIFNIPLESPNSAGGCLGSFNSGFDDPETSIQGEGNFREFTVARFLWDAYDSANDDSVNDTFNNIWAAITVPGGFNNSSHGYRSIGLLNDIQATLTGGADWSNILITHQMVGRVQYGRPLYKDPNGCSEFSKTPSGGASNLVGRGDYYVYRHSGGPLTLELHHKNSSGGTETDVDLHVYGKDVRINDIPISFKDNVMYSDELADGDTSTWDKETASRSSLAAGDYLIHVKAFPGVSNPYIYKLFANGVQLCP